MVDFGIGIVELIADINDAYETVATSCRELGVSTTGQLNPIAETDSGLLLWDEAIWSLPSYSGGPSDLFLADAATGQLTLLTATSAAKNGYVGPLAVAVLP